MFEHEDMEEGTQYCSAPGTDMDSRVVADFFFALTDERFS
jgi:hypothetical protein